MSLPTSRTVRVWYGWIAALATGLSASAVGQELVEADFDPAAAGPQVVLAEPLFLEDLDGPQRREANSLLEETSPLRQASMLQPTPFLLPSTPLSDSPAPPTSSPTLTSQLFDEGGLDRSILRQAKNGVASLSNDLVRGAESIPRVTTDVGDLLGDAPGALSVRVQRRTPMVNDTRIRGSRIGSLAASGSHWIPARADLDTAMNKIDSRLLNDVIIVPGPYSSVYGPDFNFVDFDLLQSPRYAGGNEAHGRTSFDHQSNGNQWLGQQSIWAGGENWGVRGSYSYRHGDDYRAGNGRKYPSGYESQAFAVAIGRDFRNQTSVEMSLLRLDQTDVQFPGYVFNIDNLVTDGYDIGYIDDSPGVGDRVVTEVWYNRTQFNGDAQDPSTRPEFPLLVRINYVGFTDVDSMSTGYRRGRTWGRNDQQGRLTLGHDLRFIKQELNEVADATTLGLPLPVTDRNSPIPRSYSVNPGLFGEYSEQFLKDWSFRTGARVDFVQTDIVENPANLQQLGLDFFPTTYDEIVGTDIKQTDRVMWSLYGSLTKRHSPCLVTAVSLGYAQRPPNLTALYAAQPFMLMLQNGLNNVTGDPRLKREQLIQADLSFDFDGEYLRTGARGFYGWAFDYITFENTNVVRGPPNGDVQQVSLRYVNTSLATLAGFESFAELFPQRRLTPFVNLRYVNGRDRTRNGNFATTNGRAGLPSMQVPGLPRGFFSGIPGSDSEPLPGISPLEMMIGARLRDAATRPTWNIEFAARVVDSQYRVATSLLENTTAGYTIYNLRGTFRPAITENLLIVAGIENLTDKTYRQHLDNRSLNGVSVLQPGVNFYVGSDLSY